MQCDSAPLHPLLERISQEPAAELVSRITRFPPSPPNFYLHLWVWSMNRPQVFREVLERVSRGDSRALVLLVCHTQYIRDKALASSAQACIHKVNKDLENVVMNQESRFDTPEGMSRLVFHSIFSERVSKFHRMHERMVLFLREQWKRTTGTNILSVDDRKWLACVQQTVEFDLDGHADLQAIAKADASLVGVVMRAGDRGLGAAKLLEKYKGNDIFRWLLLMRTADYVALGSFFRFGANAHKRELAKGHSEQFATLFEEFKTWFSVGVDGERTAKQICDAYGFRDLHMESLTASLSVLRHRSHTACSTVFGDSNCLATMFESLPNAPCFEAAVRYYCMAIVDQGAHFALDKLRRMLLDALDPKMSEGTADLRFEAMNYDNRRTIARSVNRLPFVPDSRCPVWTIFQHDTLSVEDANAMCDVFYKDRMVASLEALREYCIKLGFCSRAATPPPVPAAAAAAAFVVPPSPSSSAHDSLPGSPVARQDDDELGRSKVRMEIDSDDDRLSFGTKFANTLVHAAAATSENDTLNLDDDA